MERGLGGEVHVYEFVSPVFSRRGAEARRNAEFVNLPNLPALPPYLFNKHATQIRARSPADLRRSRRFDAGVFVTRLFR